MKKVVLSVLFILLTTALIFAGGGGDKPGTTATAADGFHPSWHASPTVKLGVAITLTGTQSNPGRASERGMELAVEELNAAGGIHGKRIEVVKYDDMGQPAEAIKVITRLIEQDKVHAIWGPLSSNSTMAVGAYVNDAQVPAIGPAVGVVWLRQGWKYYFRATANTFSLVEGAYDLLKKDGIKTIAYFNINEEYGNNSVKDMDSFLDKDNNINVIARELYKDGDTDFTAQCVKIRAANPDAVYMVAWSNDAGQIIRQLRAAGYDKPIYGDNAFTARPVRQIAGDASNNCFFTAVYVLPDTPEEIDSNPSFSGRVINHFLKAYLKKYGELPIEDNAYRAYDGIRVIAKAIENAKSLRGPDIRDAIHAISGFEGCIGIMNYAAFPNGECVSGARGWKMENGKVLPHRQ